jgi:hypothetical protein
MMVKRVTNHRLSQLFVNQKDQQLSSSLKYYVLLLGIFIVFSNIVGSASRTSYLKRLHKKLIYMIWGSYVAKRLFDLR